MQATSTFATYQAGPEMNEFDITSYFDLATASQQGMQASEDAIIANMSEADLAAASPEEMQACEDIIMAGMCEAAIMADMSAADAMAVSSQPQYSSTIGVNDLPIYVYTEFGERYILTPEQQQEAIAAAEFEAFLSEINLLAKQQSSLEKARKKAAKMIAKEEKRQAREAAREARESARQARETAREAQHATREARKADREAQKADRDA
jgi:hypothetical protein